MLLYLMTGIHIFGTKKDQNGYRHLSFLGSIMLHFVFSGAPKILLATTSTNGKCRVFSTFIKGVDTRESKAGSSSDSKFGEVLFVSEKMVIGVGFDCNPMVFAADESGIWSFIRFLGERKASSSGLKYGSQLYCTSKERRVPNKAVQHLRIGRESGDLGFGKARRSL
ncbi:uncharacterized protein LOC111292494 isoform X2 [Durio zibethinus]|uniref:Uncharacterized protein LOC111292494 isoform X2 n=1 Tax=Durio zibethinus TaxID=66656 RepID=A0A6P5YKP5_DURZI|nr:uncharacterized protein LOC111292494 isoform X2 [Durio zibethinus]